ncbi:hypothetical protein F2Q69_00058702 [Brassica cretica]|uniref:Uncharacterized protein n=1 Tax=Brassica cretica TaxID=69181 RepID=A0A8S9RKU8_BRACR|nr:hypothetical protein F2Q69_00058702 [Brassica cretica]
MTSTSIDDMTSTSTDDTTSTSIDGTTSMFTDGRTSMSIDGTTSTSTDGTTSTSIDDSTLKSIDISIFDPTSDGDREITMEDFLELEEFLELEDGDTEGRAEEADVNFINGIGFQGSGNQVVKEEKLQEEYFEVESLMSFGGSHWSRSPPTHEHRSTEVTQNRTISSPRHRSTTPTESTASCNVVRIMTHEEIAAKHPHPPSPVYINIDRHFDPTNDRHKETVIDRHQETVTDRQQRAPID